MRLPCRVSRTNSAAADGPVEVVVRASCRASAPEAGAAAAGAGDAEATGEPGVLDDSDSSSLGRTTACFVFEVEDVAVEDAVLRARGDARLDVVRRVADVDVPDGETTEAEVPLV